MDPERAARLRSAMVEYQLRRRGITDERVLAAMAWLPREEFVPHSLIEDAYDDSALPVEAGQSISQPYIVACMSEALAPRPGIRVLEVGTGTGYQAALLARIGCHVITMERLPELAESARARLDAIARRLAAPELAAIEIEVGDGSMGHSSGGPFEGILVTAAAPVIPSRLREQLADGGRLVIPVGPLGSQELVLVTRHRKAFTKTDLGGCVFVPLIGSEAYTPETIEAAGFARHLFGWMRGARS
jgi:protein-L-isoaspartate(D-aspartate) O-methyltransferase